MPSLQALAYLGWRAIAVQPVKRLFQRGTALQRFAAAYQGEGLLPTSLADRELFLAGGVALKWDSFFQFLSWYLAE